MVTSVKCVWNVITADKYSFLIVILLSLFFVACTGASPRSALEIRSLNSNTKVSRAQVHSLSEGPWCSFDLLVNAHSFLKISKQ